MKREVEGCAFGLKFTATTPINLFFIQRNWRDSDIVAGGEDSKQGVSGGNDETTLTRVEAVDLHWYVSRKLVSEWKLERDMTRQIEHGAPAS